MDKEFKTIEEQIEILKERNLIVNEERAKEIFRDNNYYYLINGYKDLFIDENSEEEKYKEGWIHILLMNFRNNMGNKIIL